MEIVWVWTINLLISNCKNIINFNNIAQYVIFGLINITICGSFVLLDVWEMPF